MARFESFYRIRQGATIFQTGEGGSFKLARQVENFDFFFHQSIVKACEKLASKISKLATLPNLSYGNSSSWPGVVRFEIFLHQSIGKACETLRTYFQTLRITLS